MQDLKESQTSNKRLASGCSPVDLVVSAVSCVRGGAYAYAVTGDSSRRSSVNCFASKTRSIPKLLIVAIEQAMRSVFPGEPKNVHIPSLLVLTGLLDPHSSEAEVLRNLPPEHYEPMFDPHPLSRKNPIGAYIDLTNTSCDLIVPSSSRSTEAGRQYHSLMLSFWRRPISFFDVPNR